MCFRTDNMAVVAVLKSHTAKDPLLMHLVRCLIFYAAIYRFHTYQESSTPQTFHSLVPQIPACVEVPQAM